MQSSCHIGRAIQLGIWAGLGQNIGKKMSLGWYRALYSTEEEAQFEYEREKSR